MNQGTLVLVLTLKNGQDFFAMLLSPECDKDLFPSHRHAHGLAVLCACRHRHRNFLPLVGLPGPVAGLAGVPVPRAPAAALPAGAPHHERARRYRLHSGAVAVGAALGFSARLAARALAVGARVENANIHFLVHP